MTKQDQAHQHLRLMREAGVTAGEMCAYLGDPSRSKHVHVSEMLRRLCAAGHARWVHEPAPGAYQTKRYYASEFAPEITGEATRQPGKKPAAAPRLVDSAAPVTGMDTAKRTTRGAPPGRYAVTLGPGYVSALDSRECRAWAAAAASGEKA